MRLPMSPHPTFHSPIFPANQAICVKTALGYIVNSRCTENDTFEVQHEYSSIAQLAEHSTVNRRVTGSSPVGGAFLAPFYLQNAGGRGFIIFVYWAVSGGLGRFPVVHVVELHDRFAGGGSAFGACRWARPADCGLLVIGCGLRGLTPRKWTRRESGPTTSRKEIAA